MHDTIFALVTPLGKSGVAIIRISGPSAYLAIQHFKVDCDLKPRIATITKIYDNNTLLDEALLLYFPGPKSFTGEDVLEIHIHGSLAIIKILTKKLNEIFRMAEPGEFSRRAFLNDKIDLTRAEALCDMINAETEMQVKQAARQMSGELAQLYKDWRTKIIKIMANIEVYIDFPEDDIAHNVTTNICESVEELTRDMAKHLQDNRRGERLRSGFYITIIGAPNVGKSTLLNHLAQRDIAITSEHAGTTRDIIEAHLDIAGYPVIIADTAGLRESIDVIESQGIQRTKQRAGESDLTIAMFDNLHNLDNHTKSLLNNNAIYVASKADFCTDEVRIFAEEMEFIPISVHKNIGINKLLNEIKSKLECRRDKAPQITRERHRIHVNAAHHYLTKFNLQKPIELAAEDLRVAGQELEKITGTIHLDEVLDEIFSNFCIGK